MTVSSWKLSTKRHKRKVRVAPAIAPAPVEEKANWIELEQERLRELDERLRRNRAARLARLATG